MILKPSSYNRLGRHTIVEIWGINHNLLRDHEMLKQLFIESCIEAGATVLHSHFHKFGEDGGITGVVVLAESHASVHTWPEYGYAAVDVFMCGNCDPRIAVENIRKKLNGEVIDCITLQRGIL